LKLGHIHFILSGAKTDQIPTRQCLLLLQPLDISRECIAFILSFYKCWSGRSKLSNTLESWPKAREDYKSLEKGWVNDSGGFKTGKIFSIFEASRIAMKWNWISLNEKLKHQIATDQQSQLRIQTIWIKNLMKKTWKKSFLK
jgi:hypothetical protein